MRSWTDEDLRVALATHTTIAGVLRSLGLSTSPGNYKSVQAHIKRSGLDTTHLLGKAHGSSMSPTKKALPEILVNGSRATSAYLRKRLLKAELLKNQCSMCPQGPYWNGKPLTLQLDHINGDSSDNRIENLRIVCPNCHTQTKTFTGANRSSRYRRQENLCLDCRTPVTHNAERCHRCAGKAATEHKIVWPMATLLAEEVVRTSYVAVATRLGVTDTAIKKHLRRTLGHAPRKHLKPHGGRNKIPSP